MSNSKILVSILATLILSSTPLSAQFGLGRGKDKEKDRKDKAAVNASKEARKYEQLKQFTLDLYEKDIDFRDEVDEHYDNVQRTHSLEAFQYNVAEPARHTVVHDGDRLRLQEGLYDNKLVQDYLNRIGQS